MLNSITSGLSSRYFKKQDDHRLIVELIVAF